MRKVKRRRLPIVLMALGAIMALAALAMLSRTPGLLQYCVTAPEPGEKGTNYAKLATQAAKLDGSMKDALDWVVAGGSDAIVTVNAGDKSADAALWAIGEGWLEVYPRFLEQGRRIGESELKDGARVAMLDAELAFQLFGEELPEAAAVKLNDVEFRVVGTVRHAGGLFGGRGVGDGQRVDIYIPLSAAGAAEFPLEAMTLSALPTAGGAGSAQLFEEAARTQWQAGGELVNLKKEAMRRTILPRIALLIAGLYAIVGLFRRMTALAEGRVAGFREALTRSYFKALIPKLLGLIGLILLGYGALIGLTYLLLVFSAQPLYVFTEWVPENIVAWSSISKVFWSLTAEAARLVRVGTRELREVEFWGGFTRWGTVLFLLGAALRGEKRVESEE